MIPFITLLIFCLMFVVSANSPSDYRVQTVTVGSDVVIPCITDNSSLSTYLRYSSDPNMANAIYIVSPDKDRPGYFKVDESYEGRVSLHNSMKVILHNVTVKDSGFYYCRVDFENGSEEINRIHLKIGGTLPVG